MYRISASKPYAVEHFANGDALPSPTAHVFDALPAAWVDAFGRAAKMALMLNGPQTVTVQDGRQYRVTVERI